MKKIFKFGGIGLILLTIAAGLTLYWMPLWVSDQQIRLKMWHAGIQSKYVSAGGYRLHYFEAVPPRLGNGRPAAEIPIVLIHGLGSRGEDWSPMIPSLAAHGFHVYAPDLPGFGRSAHPADADYSIAFQAAAIADFMHAVHVDHADVIGWSMGGWVAAKLTLDHPDMVDRLALYDAAGIYFPYTFDSSLFVPNNAAGLNHLSAMLTPTPMHIPAFAVRDALRQLQANRMVIERSVDQMLSGRDLLDFRLQQVNKPTLIVWGADDRLIPLTAGETMHRDIRDSVFFVVQNCGHLAPAECSRPVLEVTIPFFTSNTPPERAELSVPRR